MPADYVAEHVELAYATTDHGAQGETVEEAHFLIGEHTGAAAAYVAMTRGRQHNTAHLVADDIDDARRQWVEIFSRDRADLGPAHAAHRAADDIDRYGPNITPRYIDPRRRPRIDRHRTPARQSQVPPRSQTTPPLPPEPGIGL
ncbi:helicase C-terminal domain-containing protein [Nocardioides sp. NPDC047086]|uniref:helicase C-terminal domain-containing protein n=1 Tax=Nocardioides sp. NPDC047086 TaxID=3154810 RepID=UPI0033FCF38C